MHLIEATHKKYLIGSVLGSGGYSEVKAGVDMDSQQEVAIKIVSAKYSHLAMGEFDLTRKLKHPSIVSTHDWFIIGDQTYIVMDKLGTDMFGFMEKYGDSGLPEEVLRKVLRDVAEALVYAHSQDIVHLDIKPDNILFDEDMKPVLIDWGLASSVANGKKLKNFVGSLQYCAPEILRGLAFDGKKADSWSFGVLLYVCASGLFPWPGKTNSQVRQNIMLAEFLWPPKSLSDGFKDLLKQLLKPNPEERLSMEEVLKHPWYTQC